MTARLQYFAVTLMVLAALLTCSTHAAYAYVDPGTGLLVYQSMTAFATGVMFYFRRRLKLFLFRKGPDSDKGQENS